MNAPLKIGRRFRVDLLTAIGIVIAVAVLISLLLVTATSTLRARLNVVQAGAALFFLATTLRYAKARPVEMAGATSERRGPFGLWLSLVVGGAVWALMVPFYFIGDDFDHLARAQGPAVASLWDLTTRGQLGTFLRPVGFATIFLDYRLYGFWAPGYHMTNLIIHLASVAGVYYLVGRASLWMASRLTGFSDLCSIAH